MATISLLTCCRGASVDKFSNSLSIFEILEEVTPEAFPTVVNRVWIVAMADRSPGDDGTIMAKLRFRNDHRLMFETDIEFTFSPGSTGSRALLELPGIAIIEPSDLLIEMSFPNAPPATARIRVNSRGDDRRLSPPKKLSNEAKPAAKKVGAKSKQSR